MTSSVTRGVVRRRILELLAEEGRSKRWLARELGRLAGETDGDGKWARNVNRWTRVEQPTIPGEASRRLLAQAFDAGVEPDYFTEPEPAPSLLSALEQVTELMLSTPPEERQRLADDLGELADQVVEVTEATRVAALRLAELARRASGA